jgi:hypothetical protein
MDQRRFERGEAHLGFQLAGGVADDIQRVSGSDGEVDDDQRGEGNPGAWSASSITSSGEGEKWPEELGQRWASTDDDCIDSLRSRSSGGYHQMRQS